MFIKPAQMRPQKDRQITMTGSAMSGMSQRRIRFPHGGGRVSDVKTVPAHGYSCDQEFNAAIVQPVRDSAFSTRKARGAEQACSPNIFAKRQSQISAG